MFYSGIGVRRNKKRFYRINRKVHKLCGNKGFMLLNLCFIKNSKTGFTLIIRKSSIET